MPGNSWGSPEKMKAWVASFEKKEANEGCHSDGS